MISIDMQQQQEQSTNYNKQKKNNQKSKNNNKQQKRQNNEGQKRQNNERQNNERQNNEEEQKIQFQIINKESNRDKLRNLIIKICDMMKQDNMKIDGYIDIHKKQDNYIYQSTSFDCITDSLCETYIDPQFYNFVIKDTKDTNNFMLIFLKNEQDKFDTYLIRKEIFVISQNRYLQGNNIYFKELSKLDYIQINIDTNNIDKYFFEDEQIVIIDARIFCRTNQYDSTLKDNFLHALNILYSKKFQIFSYPKKRDIIKQYLNGRKILLQLDNQINQKQVDHTLTIFSQRAKSLLQFLQEGIKNDKIVSLFFTTCNLITNKEQIYIVNIDYFRKKNDKQCFQFNSPKVFYI